MKDSKSIVEKIAHYCQKCRAANDAGESNCRRCGTRLMLVVLPPSARHEAGIAPTFYEDHLLERVSLLELRVSQLTEQLVMAYEFIQREAKSSQKDHALIESFFESLEKVRPDVASALSLECLDIDRKKLHEIEVDEKRELDLELILIGHDHRKPEPFSRLVSEGIRLLNENEEKQAFQTLERATLLSPKNVPLLIYLGKNLFKADKFDDAKFYLVQAFEIDPQNVDILVLLGTIYADGRETEMARKLLSLVSNFPSARSFADLVWGILASYEGNWLESLAAFKESLLRNDTAETNYLIGCVYVQLGHERLALEHLENAVSHDIRYSDAWFMKSLVYESANKGKPANQARLAAIEAREPGAQCTKFLNRREKLVSEISLPFQHFLNPKKRLLTGGSRRLNLFLQEQIAKITDGIDQPKSNNICE